MNLFNNFFPHAVFISFSDRTQDFTLADGQADLTPSQKQSIIVNLPPETQVFYGRQVHGNRVVRVTKGDVPVKPPLIHSDGFVTDVPRIALAVRTADCLPIFLFDPKEKCIAMVHAGWKGTRAGIVQRAVEAMKKYWHSSAADMLASFGPAIRPCCYEVSAEFTHYFPGYTVLRDNKIFLDMAAANKAQLLELGLKPANILDSGACTCCDKQFFSFRREKDKAGRHVSIIMLRG